MLQTPWARAEYRQQRQSQPQRGDQPDVLHLTPVGSTTPAN